MDEGIRQGRRERLNTGLEVGRKVDTESRNRERLLTRPMTPPGADRTDPDRGTGEMGIEGLDPGAPLDENRGATAPANLGHTARDES